mmetsp:Transcript_5257/g.8134  ORF Transcript_5257/g.8134 Transcript_5257/m.8134 type:complete len:192 (-) Transcript_5257:103-678(-)
MGGVFGKSGGSKKEFHVVMLGLDAAGKTSILFRISRKEVVRTIPTIGFNKELVKYGNLRMSVMDVGGQHAIRSVWKHYMTGVDAVVFVMDLSDSRRIEEATEEFKRVLTEKDARDVPILLLLNKKDVPDALDAEEVKTHVLDHVPTLESKRYKAVAVSAHAQAQADSGLDEAMDWLSQALKDAPKNGKRRK